MATAAAFELPKEDPKKAKAPQRKERGPNLELVEDQEIPKRVSRLSANGNSEIWTTKEIPGNNNVFLNIGNERFAVIPKEEFFAEQEILEQARAAEKHWEPLLDLIAQDAGDSSKEEKVSFFNKNKGRILELAGVIAKKEGFDPKRAMAISLHDALDRGEVPPIDYAKVLLETLSGVEQDYFETENAEERERQRAEVKLAHAIQFADTGRFGGDGVKARVGTREDLIRDGLGDEKFLSLLVDHNFSTPEPDALKGYKNFAEFHQTVEAERTKVVEVLRAGGAPLDEIQELEDHLLTQMNVLLLEEGKRAVQDEEDLPEAWREAVSLLSFRKAQAKGKVELDRSLRKSAAKAVAKVKKPLDEFPDRFDDHSTKNLHGAEPTFPVEDSDNVTQDFPKLDPEELVVAEDRAEKNAKRRQADRPPENLPVRNENGPDLKTVELELDDDWKGEIDRENDLDELAKKIDALKEQRNIAKAKNNAKRAPKGGKVYKPEPKLVTQKAETAKRVEAIKESLENIKANPQQAEEMPSANAGVIDVAKLQADHEASELGLTPIEKSWFKKPSLYEAEIHPATNGKVLEEIARTNPSEMKAETSGSPTLEVKDINPEFEKDTGDETLEKSKTQTRLVTGTRESRQAVRRMKNIDVRGSSGVTRPDTAPKKRKPVFERLGDWFNGIFGE